MAKEVLTNAKVLVNNVNLSDHCSSVALEDSADEVEFTAFGAGYREKGQGLKDASITLSLFNDHAVGSVADTFQGFYSSGGTVETKVWPDASGTVVYTMTARVFSNPLVSGAVGEANTIDVTLMNAGTASGITRGTA